MLQILVHGSRLLVHAQTSGHLTHGWLATQPHSSWLLLVELLLRIRETQLRTQVDVLYTNNMMKMIAMYSFI